MPFKRPEGGELLDGQKEEFNKQVNKIRYIIEHVAQLQDQMPLSLS
jgi:hypothetical protein